MTNRKHFVAIYERDREADAWLVHIDGIEACHTYGRTLHQAGERIDEALALWLDRDPDQFVLEHQWPTAVIERRGRCDGGTNYSGRRGSAASQATTRAARSNSPAWASAAVTPPRSSASPTNVSNSSSRRRRCTAARHGAF